MDWPARARIARERLARRLADDEHPYPDFAACLLVARGARALNIEQFAELVGMDATLLAELESGDRSPTEAPRRLIQVADEDPRPWPQVSGL